MIQQTASSGGVLSAFRVRVLCLDDGGADRLTAVQLLRMVVADGSRAPAAFKALEVRCQELARRRTHWAPRDELAGGLEHDGFALGPDLFTPLTFAPCGNRARTASRCCAMRHVSARWRTWRGWNGTSLR